jgi:YgiT-type zinc finger domain-containing protein
MIQITICPSCASKRIKTVRQDWTGKFQGQSYTVPSLEFYECPDCGERIYDREAMRRIEAHSPAFAMRHVEPKAHVKAHA